MTHQSLTTTARPARLGPAVRRPGLLALLLRWDAAWRQRRALCRMTEAERRDMGLPPGPSGAPTLRELADHIPARRR